MENKKFADVAHLYIGCQVMRPDNITILKLEGVHGFLGFHSENNNITYSNIQKVKPILRKLEDMTEEDSLFSPPLNFNRWGMPVNRWGIPEIESMAERINYLLSKGYDLFNLIENSEALDIKNK